MMDLKKARRLAAVYTNLKPAIRSDAANASILLGAEVTALEIREKKLMTALSNLVEVIVRGEEHGDGADDDRCEVCVAIRAAQEIIRR